jgi:peptidoglycan glycosyltransferase
VKILFAKHSRVRILSGILTVTVALIVVRLFQLQVIDHQKYRQLAYQEQVKKLTIPAHRGLIYALDHQTPAPLVMNETVYTMFVDPQVVKDDKAVLAALVGLNQDLIIGNPAEKLTQKNTRYQVLARGLSRQQAEAIKAKKLTGIGFQAVSRRIYPEGALASQVLGFVNANGGQYGVEGKLDKRLTGENGVLEAVTDISDVPLTVGEKYTNIPARNGDNLVLSIDRNIQSQVEKILKAGLEKVGADNGSALVMNPQTGQIMAMVNYPSYSVAEFNKVKDVALFNNATVDRPYEAGSVIKVFTVAMGINEGKITPQTVFYNQDTVKVGDRTIKNAYKGKIGNITMQDALQYSLNTGMVNIISRLGGGNIDRSARNIIYNYFHDRFQLGQKTNVELPETAGVIIPPTEVEGNAVRYSNMSFGQGMDVTMVQVAAGFSAIINGGVYYQPTVLAGTVENGIFKAQAPKVIDGQVVKNTTSTQVRQMLTEARRLYYKNVDRAGYEIGGKTGTSEKIVDGKYVENQTIATYLGYGGTNRPEYVIMIRVDGKGKYLAGNTDAAPIFTDISNWLIDYLKLYPKE